MYTTCLSRHSTAISLVMHLAPAGKMGSCNCGMDSSVWLTWSAGASQKVAQAHSSDSRRRGVDFRRSESSCRTAPMQLSAGDTQTHSLVLMVGTAPPPLVPSGSFESSNTADAAAVQLWPAGFPLQ